MIVIALLMLALFVGFYSLGMWQVHRRAWKLDLIAKVDQRVHRPAADAPGLGQWPAVNAANDEYRHVRITGTLRHDKETLVQATTEYGSGYWVMTPLQLDGGGMVMVNRGFVMPEWRKRSDRDAGPAGEVTVTGLLRMDEPHGGFLRTNAPDTDLWYTRDLQAIAAKRGLAQVAPYFIDMEAAPGGKTDPNLAPVPGLTVISFPNSHLTYAVTWFALAAMSLGGAGLLLREERRRRAAGK
jgi:surfeit locus 1 family protein